MRETYVAPADAGGLRTRRGSARPSAGALLAAVGLDTAAVGFTSGMLWLGAGTTVMNGDALSMAVAFAGGSALAGLSNLLQARAGARGAAVTSTSSLALLAAGFAVHVTVLSGYFFAWVLVYAGAFLIARTAVTAVIDAFSGRSSGALPWRLAAVVGGAVVIALLSDVWSDSTVLADLCVFVVLLAVAAVLCELGIRSFRASRSEAG